MVFLKPLPKEDSVVEVTEKVKPTEKEKIYDIPYMSSVFRCDQCKLKFLKKLLEAYGHQALEEI